MSNLIDEFKYKIKRLPLNKKIIGLGSLLVALSVIMPWYSDLDAWGYGNNFSAVRGPLYLIGIFVFLLGIFSGAIMAGREIFRKNWHWPLKDSLAHIAVSGLIVFFLIIANSVFFHKDFGVNILRKETRFGMFMAFIGALMIGVGGYLDNKQEEKIQAMRHSADSSAAKPLINLNERNQILKVPTETSPAEADDINLKLNI